MDKPTAQKMVDNHAKKVLEYNSGKFKFGELQDSRAALIGALTNPTKKGPVDTIAAPEISIDTLKVWEAGMGFFPDSLYIRKKEKSETPKAKRRKG